ncbi:MULTISPECIES: type II toxin-antitoxin system RelB/DinJ family antitoxin [unclassified Bartonella]|uniref:type II toxin-antitoxin system RelB/DinJ family antitoxin n=1 Tax=unclassified Bartonella TaxID=2645622 RepID=UPI0035CEC5B3
MARIQVHVPDAIKHVSEEVIQSTGLTISDAVRMLMVYIAKNEVLPLDLFQPSPETLQAIKDAEDGCMESMSLDDLRNMICNDEDKKNELKKRA